MVQSLSQLLRRKFIVQLANECKIADRRHIIIKRGGRGEGSLHTAVAISLFLEKSRKVDGKMRYYAIPCIDPVTGMERLLTINEGGSQIALEKKDPLLPFTEENTIIIPFDRKKGDGGKRRQREEEKEEEEGKKQCREGGFKEEEIEV
jgi:hypothetical protein